MKRISRSFQFESIGNVKSTLLQHAHKNFNTVCFFDNNHYNGYEYKSYEALLAMGLKDYISCSYGNAFNLLKNFFQEKEDWLFGFFGYDLKNEIEKLHSKNFDGLLFPDLYFFQPEIVVEIFKEKIVVHAFDENEISKIHSILNPKISELENFHENENLVLKARFSKEKYLESVGKILKHIKRGDIYEMNFCIEFFSENANISPLKIFESLNEFSQAPFSCFLKFEGRYLLCASPERFLKKNDRKIISMPIKGTIRREKDEKSDAAVKEKLLNDPKERSENVMIVDLVRNDLSRSCIAGSVTVEELFGVKTFEHVHHLVSTVSGILEDDIHFIDAIKIAFPMGSMTGAPKVRAMELIEEFEKTKRGLFSGAAGYIKPNTDFDFNVVIRSLIYDSEKKYLSLQAGSAITFESDPEKEYDECVLKAEALMQILNSECH